MQNKKLQTHFDVIVVGGGAAGMMAAGVAGERGKKVLILEKNKHLGKKLKITGGGRCNITNGEKDIRALLKRYGDAEQFLYSPFSKFGVSDAFSFFESKNLPLVVQAEKRAFPHTERALDVFKVLEKYLKDSGVKVMTSSPVSKVTANDNKITSIACDKNVYTADSYIFATGGMSHPETGSTGDGFKWLASIGHTVAKPTPTVVPLRVKEAWVHSLAGISISDIKITFCVNGKKDFAKSGKILFTHFGLSGPLILNSAKKVADLIQLGAVTAEVDLFPKLDHGTLDAKILSIFNNNKNKMLKNCMSDIVPAGTAPAILSLLHMDTDTKTHSVSKDDRKAIVELLKALPMTVTGLMGFDRAVVADGGVDLREIDTKTMRSKKISNLYITGDLLHISRPSGGFSLQLCWTTGYVAGDSA